MSERDDLTEQAFHDPLHHTSEAVTRSALAAAGRTRELTSPFEVGQQVLYLAPPAGGEPIEVRVVAIGAESCLIAGIGKGRNQHWIRHEHLRAIGATA